MSLGFAHWLAKLQSTPTWGEGSEEGEEGERTGGRGEGGRVERGRRGGGEGEIREDLFWV